METYRLPYGPNGKAKLSILSLYRGLYFPKKNNKPVYFIIPIYRGPYGNI